MAIEVKGNTVRIYDNDTLIATHPELKQAGEFSTKTEHYPHYKCLSSTEYQEKYQAKMAGIGAYAEKLFFCILETKQNCWSRPIQGILALNKRYSNEIINRSCERALVFGVYDYKVIKRICENGSYHLPIEKEVLNHAID